MSAVLLFLFLILFADPPQSSEAKGDLRYSTAANKHFISQLDEGSFEIVHPFQQRENKERIGIDTRNYFLVNATSHYKHVVIVVRSNSPTVAGSRLKLVLHLNEHLLYSETQFSKLDERGESSVKGVENCYYQGTVSGDPESVVALSTCSGIWGIIGWRNGTTLGIWPLDGGRKGSNRRHPHVLYRAKWNIDAACSVVPGAGAGTPQSLAHSMALRMPPERASGQNARRFLHRRQVIPSKRAKYLELALIGDHAFVESLNLTEGTGFEYMLHAANIADLVYAELWMDAQRVDLQDAIGRTLDGAIDYVTGHLQDKKQDASLLLTGGKFSNREMLSATASSVCKPRALALVKANDAYFAHVTAQMATHALGHVLGIDHDSSECSCGGPSSSTCVMNQQVGSIGAAFAWEFSLCSVARLENSLAEQSEHLQCLRNRPFQEAQLYQCGNGVVDGDEECDCGRRDECTDPCCDPISCTLRAFAKCAAHQACCHRCELRQEGHLCREASSPCDVPEMCDGVNGDCPADGHLVDGVPCGVDGQCWRGNCSDIAHQCKQLWGTDAEPAEEPCYGYNEKGLEYGNCGMDKNDGSLFVSCTPTNSRCGTLHCRGGASTPLSPSLTSFNLHFQHGDSNNKRQIQCKVITNAAAGGVADGSSCGSGKVCIAHACVPLAQVSPPIHCPSNNLALQCSGHGDCTTTEKCLCYDGWAGLMCDIRSNTTSRRIPFFAATTPNSTHIGSIDLLNRIQSLQVKTLDTTTLLIILLLVGIILLLMLICLLFCYRRKSSARVHRSGVDDKVEEEESLSPDDPGRAIKFAGQLPSYREEKIKRRKNKHVYDALQRINEATEERDSASLRSKESSTANNSVVNQFTSTPTKGAAAAAAALGSHYRSNHSLLSAKSDNASGSLRLTHQRTSPGRGYTRATSIREGMLSTNGHTPPPPQSMDLYLNNGATLKYTPFGCEFPSRTTSSSPTRSDYSCGRRGHPDATRQQREQNFRPLNGYATDTEIHCTNIRHPNANNNSFRRMSNYNQRDQQQVKDSYIPLLRTNCSERTDGAHVEVVDRGTPSLRLQSIQMLMTRLHHEEAGMANEEMELCALASNGAEPAESASLRACHDQQRAVYPEPPPASTDSGHPASSGSNYDIRESPSLFSDAFKLDLSS